MRVNSVFICERCNMVFDTVAECVAHEEVCGAEIEFACQCCGDTYTWVESDPQAFAIKNSCHTIDLGVLGYGTESDGSNVELNVCDYCLVNWVGRFKIKPQFLQEEDDYIQRMSEAYKEVELMQ